MLGHFEDELDRLARQARAVDPIARRSFLEAGVGVGMRVLDVSTLRERIMAEVLAAGSVVRSHLQVGAWCVASADTGGSPSGRG